MPKTELNKGVWPIVWLGVIENALFLAGVPHFGESLAIEYYETAAAKIAAATGGKRYTAYYLRNIALRKQPPTEPIYDLCLQYVRLREKLPSENGRPHVNLIAPKEVNIVDGSLVLAASRLCPCGVWFIPDVWNKKYHTPACKKRFGK